jgi:hypothetical protein
MPFGLVNKVDSNVSVPYAIKSGFKHHYRKKCNLLHFFVGTASRLYAIYQGYPSGNARHKLGNFPKGIACRTYHGKSFRRDDTFLVGPRTVDICIHESLQTGGRNGDQNKEQAEVARIALFEDQQVCRNRNRHSHFEAFGP